MKNELNKVFDLWKKGHLEDDTIALKEFMASFSAPYLTDYQLYNLDYFLCELYPLLPKAIHLSLINFHTDGFKLSVREAPK